MDFKNYRVKSISCTGIDKYRFRAKACVGRASYEKKEAIKKFWINLLITTPLGAALFGGIIGWLSDPFLGIVTAIIQVIIRAYFVFDEYKDDMIKLNGG